MARLRRNETLNTICRGYLRALCMLSHFSCVQLFLIPWTITHQAPLSVGLSRQEYWSRPPCSPPGNLPDPEMEPDSPVLQVDSLPMSHPGNSTEELASCKLKVGTISQELFCSLTIP